MKTRSNSQPPNLPLKTPTEQFITTVTNFQNNYGVNHDHDNHGRHRKISSVYTNSSYSDQNESTSTTSALGNFLLVYFETVYFLLTCPFRIGKDSRGKFIIKKHRFHTIICAIMHLMCFIRLMTEVRFSIEKEYSCKNASKNPVQYFNIILDVSSFVYKMTTIKRFWFNQADYLDVFTFIQRKRLLRVEPKSVKFYQTLFFLRVFFGLVAAHTLVSFIVGKNIIDQSYEWSASLWSNQLVKLARFTFCLDKHFNIKDVTPLKTITTSDILFTVIMSISLIQRFIIGLFSDIFLLSHAITLWMAAKSFATSIDKDVQIVMKREQNVWGNMFENHKSDKDRIINNVVPENYGRQHYNHDDNESLQWPDIYKRFRVVQKLTMVISIALGSQVTWYMAEAVMYYSVSLNKFLTSHDAFVRVDLAVFYFTTFGILFISADICSQMEHLKVWISVGDNRKTIPADEFSIVLHEMIAKDIGIRGSNVFTITYPLLAVFFSTIVTYFIICVQQDVDSISVLQGNNTRC